MQRNKFYVLDDSGEFEVYWTGNILSDPATTRTLDKAMPFETSKAAYEAARRSVSEKLEGFKVGRRPHPIYLTRGKRR